MRKAALDVVGRTLAIIIAVLGAGRISIGLYAWQVANKLERPSYDTIKLLGDGVELRRYQPYLIAETTIPSSNMKDGSGQGFRTVAGYIFGKNKGKTKMSMTAPVRMSRDGGGEKMKMTAPVRVEPGASARGNTKVSFVLEKEYTRGTAPRPLSRAVRVRDVRPHVLAVRAFSGGPPSEGRVERERTRILSQLAANELQPSKPSAEPLVYGYHDPFITPSFLRRNEVCVEVTDCAALRDASA
mmetsp:Transcript_29404/g.94095  ORF Transcript_29404/g.94095 Transcript_29404/m.94095 type:complete len:242 (-) Transcript_29404:37-762(-)